MLWTWTERCWTTTTPPYRRGTWPPAGCVGAGHSNAIARRAWCLVEDVARDGLRGLRGAGQRGRHPRRADWGASTGREWVRSRCGLSSACCGLGTSPVCQNGRAMDGSCGVEKREGRRRGVARLCQGPSFEYDLHRHGEDSGRGQAEKFNVFHVEPEERGAVAIAATGPVAAPAPPPAIWRFLPKAGQGCGPGCPLRTAGHYAGGVTFGDAENDLGMLSWAGCSFFAMANGSKVGAKAALYYGPQPRGGGGGRRERFALGEARKSSMKHPPPRRSARRGDVFAGGVAHPLRLVKSQGGVCKSLGCALPADQHFQPGEHVGIDLIPVRLVEHPHAARRG